MTHGTKPPVEPIEALLAMLQTLRHAPGGEALLGQVERGRRVHAEFRALLDRAFITFVRNAVDRYGRTAASDRVTRLKLRLVEQRLAHLAKTEPESIPVADAAALTQHLAAVLWAAGQNGNARPEPRSPAAAPVDGLKPLQHTLEGKLDRAILANLDSIASLGSIELTLKGAQTGELEEWRAILHDATREIIEDYRELGETLRQAQLCARELGRLVGGSGPAHAELPGPGRGELLRQLEAEMRRAQRYRLPLSLALLGPDHLEDIRLLVGPQAAYEIMRRYQESIAACARAYDTVTGCPPHKLLWLLPGADPTQGMRALRKAQERLNAVHYHHGGRLRPLPSFSAGIVGFEPGENSVQFLARAEVLAARAKLAGPSRIECEKRRAPAAPATGGADLLSGR